MPLYVSKSLTKTAGKIFSICSLSLLLFSCSDTSFNAKNAWHELTNSLQNNYAYLDRATSQHANFNELQQHFKQKALKTASHAEFIDISQQYLRTFRDPHLNIGPMDENDYIVYPTGADIYAERDGQVVKVLDVKADSAAHQQGIRPDMLINQIDGLSIEEAIESVVGVPSTQLTTAQQNYAINIALGGKRYQTRELEISKNNQNSTIKLAASYDSINQLNNQPTIRFSKINDLGYIRFNNSLGNNKTIDDFRQALAALNNSEGLIIDLRNTPSGGNTGVAEPILGHFVNQSTSYQHYRVQANNTPYNQAELQVAKVTPQQPFVDKPVVVLAGRWTGSMGEGMTIGLDALGAKATIGAPMADLLGGIKRVELAESGGWLELGHERLYHINGSFREDFAPKVQVTSADIDAQGRDIVLAQAIATLSSHIH